MSEKEKLLWNQAVKATVDELRLWDGVIPKKEDMEYVCKSIYHNVAYKKPKMILKKIPK